MFPKGLAREFERLFASIVRLLIRKEMNQIINLISKTPDFKKDRAGDIDDIRIPEEKGSLPVVRPSLTLINIGNEIKKRADKFKRFAESRQLTAIIKKRMNGFDKWTKSRIEINLKRSVREIKFGIGGLRKIGSASITERMLIGIQLQDVGVTAARIDALISANVNLIVTIGDDAFPRIEAIIQQGLKEGVGNKVVAKTLKEEFNRTESRAKFWARDQTAKAVSGFNKERQTNAGIPGFIWRHQKDNLVRGNPGGEYPDAINPHWDQEGKFFSWGKGWTAPDGRVLFPGMDFRCRCFAEPALGPEQAEAA